MPQSVSATTALLPPVGVNGPAMSAPSAAPSSATVTILPEAPSAGRRQADSFELVAPGETSARLATVVPFLASVGAGGQNRTTDTKVVQQRLAELGFAVTVDGRLGPQSIRAIQLFASLVEHKEQPAAASDRLLPTSELTKRLFSADAPRLVAIPDAGVGYVKIDLDGYGYATAKTLAVLERAGQHYATNYLVGHSDSSLIKINDISRHDGTVTDARGRAEHATHKNGLDVDIRLPKKPSSANADGACQVSAAEYDCEAAFAIVDAFASQAAVERVLLNDPVIAERAKRENKGWAHKFVVDRSHYNHIHVDVAF